MRKPLLACLALYLAVLLSACSNGPQTGPIETKWDRDICERCRMVLSDRKHSAQVRYLPEGKSRSKVLSFDDIGCAAIWLEDKPWRDAASTEIWVTDHRTGTWIDATKATYIKGQVTPMEYGLGAQSEPVAGGLDYAQAKAYIFEVEEKFNLHGEHLVDRLKELAKKREELNQQHQHQKGSE